ncbi:MAG: hypothetical protein HY647_09045 [Acidobacteria bacterium]|nr:hypothetical protein [Acidobacteriota bacterium]
MDELCPHPTRHFVRIRDPEARCGMKRTPAEAASLIQAASQIIQSLSSSL